MKTECLKAFCRQKRRLLPFAAASFSFGNRAAKVVFYPSEGKQKYIGIKNQTFGRIDYKTVRL